MISTKHGKNSIFRRVTAILLLLALMLSVIPTFASADESNTTEEEETENPLNSVKVLFNRNFQDGWGIGNGLTANDKKNDYNISYEVAADFSYNYFINMEYINNMGGYIQGTFPTVVNETMIFEMDISTDELYSVGKTLYFKTGSDSIWLLDVTENVVTALGDSSTATSILGEWVHVAFIFDFSIANSSDASAEEKRTLLIKAYVGDNYTEKEVVLSSAPNIGHFRIQALEKSTAAGMNLKIDNMRIYTGVDTITDISSLGYGTMVSETKNPEIEILGQEASNKKSDSLYMKVNVEWGLIDEETRIALMETTDGYAYGAPRKIDGVVYVSIYALNNILGYAIIPHDDRQTYSLSSTDVSINLSAGRKYASRNGQRIALDYSPVFLTADDGETQYFCIALSDAEQIFNDFYFFYDDMGLIGVSPEEIKYSRKKNLEDLLQIMTNFIFDFEEGEEIYNDVKENTNNFTHPYLFTTQERFDELREIYLAVEGDENYNPIIKKGMDKYMSDAVKYYNHYAIANPDGSYKCFNEENKPVNPYYDITSPDYSPDGYDPYGGRLNVPVSALTTFAVAYQLTRDVKYAYVAFDYALALGEWIHWAPAHFLNCADATYPFALSFDWLYNIYVELGLPVEELAKIIYEKGVYQGYLGSNRIPTPHPRKKIDASDYNTNESRRSNNWAAVCSSGMIIGCLAIFEFDEYHEVTTWLINNNINLFAQYGLVEYAPDGSYIESASYWAYGTNSYFRTTMALLSAAGDDYGLLDAWGVDTTCYFAMNIESSDFHLWSYNDCGSSLNKDRFETGAVDSSLFLYAGWVFNDPDIISVRLEHLERGKSCTLYDMFYWPEDFDASENDAGLTYYMDSVQAVVARSSWSEGAMYTGLMGGPNDCSHSHLDSGSFIYENAGVQWIVDPGADSYNVSGYRAFGTYAYYLTTTEGHNIFVLTSAQDELPFGQSVKGGGSLVKHYTNEHGMYAILDNSAVYPNLVSYANRGILVTNDFNTVVIQDEIMFTNVSTGYWFAHTTTDIVVSDDGKTANFSNKLRNGTVVTMRATLINKNPKAKYNFTVMSAYDFVLDSTVRPGFSEANGGVAETDRSKLRKLAISIPATLSLDIAVVFEVIDVYNPVDTGYTWIDMVDWMPVADTRVKVVDNNTYRGAAKATDVLTATVAISRMDSSTLYTTNLDTFYKRIVDVELVRQNFDVTTFTGDLLDSYNMYLYYREDYDNYVSATNGILNSNISLIYKTFGIA